MNYKLKTKKIKKKKTIQSYGRWCERGEKCFKLDYGYKTIYKWYNKVGGGDSGYVEILNQTIYFFLYFYTISSDLHIKLGIFLNYYSTFSSIRLNRFSKAGCNWKIAIWLPDLNENVHFLCWTNYYSCSCWIKILFILYVHVKWFILWFVCARRFLIFLVVFFSFCYITWLSSW